MTFVAGSVLTANGLNSALATAAITGGSIAAATVIGYVPPGASAAATNVSTKLAERASVKDFGALGNGTADDTSAVQAAINAASRIYFPKGTYLTGKISVPSSRLLFGDGPGATIIQAKNSLNDNIVINSGTNTNITIRDLEINGNYLNQTAGSGMAFTGVSNTLIENVYIHNCWGHGIVVSGGGNNIFHAITTNNNGQSAAGYGVYLSNSSRNTIANSFALNNCIGFAVEGSGAGNVCQYNKIIGCSANTNRVAFSQSGSGIHVEQNTSGDVSYTSIIGNVCDTNAGPGVTILGGTGHIVTGNSVRNNTKSGYACSGVIDITMTGGSSLGNGAGDSSGYQCGVRFDDTGVTPQSTGAVTGMRISGSVEGIKTFTTSTLTFTGCDVRGNSVHAINFAGAGNLDQAYNCRGYNPQPASPVTVLASPYTYTNNDGYPESLIISGGTVSAISFVRGGNGYSVSIVAGTFVLQPGDGVMITYTVAPTITKIPA